MNVRNSLGRSHFALPECLRKLWKLVVSKATIVQHVKTLCKFLEVRTSNYSLLKMMEAGHQLGDANEVLNEHDVVFMARMSHKLIGRDFSTSSLASANSIQHELVHSNLISGEVTKLIMEYSVKLQVLMLILQAASPEIMCQNYMSVERYFTMTLEIASKLQ